ncbi:MAG: MOSC domain-containing protein [Thermoplasmata archaeon]|nr:MOSC domain-containing protein [Candidatus Sysuiplasma acidicola]MDH2905210.1 MOSC domain-containing protein [Methanomassiliicoccales archaeon]
MSSTIVNGKENSGSGSVVAVCRSRNHDFSKATVESIRLLPGLGVEGDAHMGRTVQHLSRIAKDPNQPNLRQVHLIQYELLEELSGEGHEVFPGQMGENITTSDIDLLALPRGTQLCIGHEAVIEITGLRNPCYKIDVFQKGLMNAVLHKDDRGNLIRKAGVMGIVIAGGVVRPHDNIMVRLPDGQHTPLQVV